MSRRELSRVARAVRRTMCRMRAETAIRTQATGTQEICKQAVMGLMELSLVEPGALADACHPILYLHALLRSPVPQQ
jgi:hypothetical protein